MKELEELEYQIFLCSSPEVFWLSVSNLWLTKWERGVLWYSGQACQFSGLQPQCSPVCSRERAAEHAARTLLPAQPGRSQQQQQQMMATEWASPKGVFRAREARKPYFRLLHMLGLHLSCLSTPFFSSFLFLVLPLVHSTTYPVSSTIVYLLRIFQRSWLKAAGSITAGNTVSKTWRTLYFTGLVE